MLEKGPVSNQLTMRTGVNLHSSAQKIRRVHMIGELTKGSCSMYGAWGNATASIGGKLLQLRALDWDVEGAACCDSYYVSVCLALTSGCAMCLLLVLLWSASAGPFKNFPQITVYHGNGSAETGNTFANVGWSGWMGLITGMSQNQLAVSEIGVAFPDPSFGA